MFNRLIVVFMCFILCFCPSYTEGAIPSAISVIANSRSHGEEMKAAARQAADEAQAAADKAQAEADLKAATAEVSSASAKVAAEIAAEAAASAAVAVAEAKATEAEAKILEAEAKVAQAQEKEKIADAAAQEALVAQHAAQEAAERAQAAANRAKQAADYEAAVIANQAKEEADRVAALAADINSERMDDMAGKIDEEAKRAEALSERGAASNENAENAADKADAAAGNVGAATDKTNEAVEVKQQAADAKLEAMDLLTDAKEAANDAKGELVDAKKTAEEAKTATLEAKASLTDAKKGVTDAEASLAELAKKEVVKGKAFTIESNYYSWKDDRGNSGYQFVQPYTFAYQAKGIETSFRTAYILSQYNSASGSSSGRVSTFSDSDLSFAHTNSNKQYPVRYSLDINIPTGKATLRGSEKNAIMSDDLVEHGSYGAGWAYTPGISVSHRIGKQDTWTLSTMYSFRGKYTLDGDVPNSELTPGNDWVKTLEWQHIDKNWRMIGELSHTSYGTTKQGGVDYVKEGNQLDTKLTYVRDLPNNQSLQLYYWYSTQHHDNPLALQVGGTDMSGQYTGIMWSKNLKNNRTLRLSFDAMKKSGDSYDVLTNSYFSGGYKYTGGIGYDIEFSPKRKLSLDVQHFFLKNKSTSGADTGNHGFNVMVKYLYNF